MNKAEKINAAVSHEMWINGIENNVANRIEFLKGIQLAWNEDPETSPEKQEYQLLLDNEIKSLEKLTV